MEFIKLILTDINAAITMMILLLIIFSGLKGIVRECHKDTDKDLEDELSVVKAELRKIKNKLSNKEE